jgi:hypothetical protein
MPSLRLSQKQYCKLDPILSYLQYYDNLNCNESNKDKKLLNFIYLFDLITKLLIIIKNSRDKRYKKVLYDFFRYGKDIEKEFKENIAADNCINYKMYKRFKDLNKIFYNKYILYYINNQPIPKNYIKMHKPDCAICLNTIKNGNIIKTNCNHYYHKKCFISYLYNCNSSCPLCRRNI